MDFEEARKAGCICRWARRQASQRMLDGSVMSDEWYELDRPDPDCQVHRKTDG